MKNLIAAFLETDIRVTGLSFLAGCAVAAIVGWLL